MPTESLIDQLSRIGGFAAAAVILAAALAMFGVLELVIGRVAAAPQTQVPRTIGVHTPPIASVTATGSGVAPNDTSPLTEDQIRRQRELTRSERRAVDVARQQARSVARRIQTYSRGSQLPQGHPSSVVHGATTASSPAAERVAPRAGGSAKGANRRVGS